MVTSGALRYVSLVVDMVEERMRLRHDRPRSRLWVWLRGRRIEAASMLLRELFLTSCSER